MTNIPTNGPVDLFSFDTCITRFQSALDKNHTFPISVGEESHFSQFYFSELVVEAAAGAVTQDVGLATVTKTVCQ